MGRAMKHGGVKEWAGEHTDLIGAAVFAAVALVYHLVMSVNFGDEMEYKTVLDDMTLWEYLQRQWMVWSSRLMIDSVFLFLIDHVFLWKLLDTVLFILLGWILGRLTGEKLLCYALWLAYPFHEMSEAGWISTTTNYLWPLCLGLVVCLSLKKSLDGERIRPREYLWGVPAALYACNQELLAVVMAIVTLVCMALCLSRKRRKIPYVYLMLGIELLSLAYILACPGNYNRGVEEAALRAPEFAGLSTGMKLYMGIYNVGRLYIAVPNTVFFPAALLLAILVFRKTESCGKTLVSSIAVLLPAAHCLASTLHSASATSLEVLQKLFVLPPATFRVEEMEAAEVGVISRFLIPVYVLAVVGSMVFSLYVLLGEDLRQFLGVTAVAGAGFVSVVAMGFTPNLYASGNRVQLFFVVSLIYAAARCFHNGKGYLHFAGAGKALFTAFGVLWTGANIVSELVYIPWLSIVRGS